MARLIDAEKLIDTIKNVYCTGCSRYDSGCRSCWVGNAIDLLRDEDDSPTVDDEEVVRCKDCIHNGDAWQCPMCHMEYADFLEDYVVINNVSEDGFCHRGERDADGV